MTTCFLVVNIIIIFDDVSVCSFSISFVIPFENLKPTDNQQGNLNREKHSMSIIAHDTTCPVDHSHVCTAVNSAQHSAELENDSLMFSMLSGPVVEQEVQT